MEELKPPSDARKLCWDDLVPYLLARGPDTLNLSSGNPIVQGEIVEKLRAYYAEVVRARPLDRIVYQYNDPQGDAELRGTLAALYREHHGLPVSAENVVITPGSQAAFFYLSEVAARSARRVYFPCGPEYPGYRTHADATYRMQEPLIEKLDRHSFRYRLSPRACELPSGTLFVLLSRPGNPTGAVLSPEEIEELQGACESQDAYLVMDSAYAPPVPAITFQDLQIPWTPRSILVTSLSKAGLAGERLGAIVAPEPMVARLLEIQRKVAILASRLVQFVVNQMLRDGVYQELCRSVLRPAYVQRHTCALEAIGACWPEDLPYYVYRSGGSPFLWIWLDEPNVSTDELFRELLGQKLIVAPSSVFYLPSLQEWPHARQCLRVSIVEEPARIEKAVRILGGILRERYGGRG